VQEPSITHSRCPWGTARADAIVEGNTACELKATVSDRRSNETPRREVGGGPQAAVGGCRNRETIRAADEGCSQRWRGDVLLRAVTRRRGHYKHSPESGPEAFQVEGTPLPPSPQRFFDNKGAGPAPDPCTPVVQWTSASEFGCLLEAAIQ